MPTTSNFGWTTPADTDLVKDGAAAIRTLGNGIDSSLVDLKGGTTGQILSKASNTDLDYTWIANDQGDITEVQAGTGISVASGTGPVPVVTNTVATAFDAKGDLVAGTGADTFAKITVGANDTVLTADSSTATGLKWATAASGGSTWTSFTPTFDGFTLGNGTSAFKYSLVGEIVFVVGKIDLGSTSSFTGGFAIGTLPFNVNSDHQTESILGGISLRDFTGSFYRGDIAQYIGVATKVDPNVTKTDGTYATYAAITSTVPFTWATSDQIGVWFSYRRA